MPFFSENHALGTNPSPWTVNGTALYPDSTSYQVQFKGDTEQAKFLDTDGSASNGIAFDYSEPASNAGYLSLFYDEASLNSNLVKFSTGANLNLSLSMNGGPSLNVYSGSDARIGLGNIYPLKIITANSVRALFGASGGLYLGGDADPTGALLHVKDAVNPQLKLDDGTSSTTFQHDDNSGVPTLKMNASILEIQDAISGGGTQLVLKNNFGDSATFKQDETGQNFSIFTDDFDFKMYSTESAGSVGFANATGVRKVRYRNAENQFMISSGLRYDIHSTSSATYTLTTADGRVMILADSSSNAITINLPVASENSGRIVNIKDKGGNAGTNNITIDPNGSETIDGGATVAISSNYGSMTVLCDGANWHIFG